MAGFVLGRLAEALATLLVASIIVFAASRLTGDPAKQLISLESTQNVDAAQIRSELGLDKPIWRQYLQFLGGALHGDFGRSFRSGQPVSNTLWRRVPPSLTLALVSVAVALLIAVPLGIAAGVWRGSPIDLFARGMALAGQAMPSFWLGLLLIIFFAVKLKLFPAGGSDNWKSYILPGVTIGWLISSGIVRLLRSSMIDALESEYVRFARSYGMEEWRVIWFWALRNALIPVVTFLGFMFSIIIAGAVVVEVVFAWPGLGRLAYESVLARDFPMLQGAVMVWAVFVVGASLLTDGVYVLLDARTRS